jgi:DNA-binding response OmpR family regulator
MPEDWRDQLDAYTSNMLVFCACHFSGKSQKLGNTVKANPKILLVERDTPLAMMAVHMLSRAGCETEVATTGKKGMELAHENKFDLIVLSMDLPDISGFDIASELKQRHLTRGTPIVFVSDHANIEDQQRALEFGAADFIEKPFGGEVASRLLSHIKQAIVA